MAHLLFLGNVTRDQIFRLDSLASLRRKSYVKTMMESVGGVAAVAALTAVKLGHQVDLISRVGKNSLGEQIIAELKEKGVDTDNIMAFENVRSSLASILIDDNHQVQIFVYNDPSMPAEKELVPLSCLERAEIIAVDSTWPNAAEWLFSHAKLKQLPTISRINVNSPAIDALIQLSDIPIFNYLSLVDVSGEVAIGKALKKVAERYRCTPIVTLSDKGCAWFNGKSVKKLPAYDVDVVNSLGAGDIFLGAFVSEYALSKEIEQAVKFANIAAALHCSKSELVLNREEIFKLMK